MPSQKNILVLYTELAYYTVKCFSELASIYDVNIHILRLPISKTAPFQFADQNNRLFFYDADQFDNAKLDQLCESINPELIYCAGWTNKIYLDLCKRKHTKTKTLLGFDTQWNGSLKQIAGSVYAKWALTPFFSYAFVPGKAQAILAAKMGFKPSQIIKGAYCCDFGLFSSYSKLKTSTGAVIPKRFLYVGRYAHEKGIEDLWQAFIELQEQHPSDWELWCLGKGDISPIQHPKIKHFGFLQPSEMTKIIENTGVFVLPSSFEPWGVVVHEYTSAGFPILCSDKVGANDMFLNDNINGFVFKAGNIEHLKEKLNKFTSMPDKELCAMAQKSFELASKLTPDIWADKLLKIVKS